MHGQWIFSIRSLALAVLFVGAGPARAGDAPAWPDNFLTRVESLAVMQSLNAELLAFPPPPR